LHSETKTEMNNTLINFTGIEIPDGYDPYIEPTKRIGEKLGDMITDGWDTLVGKLFRERLDVAVRNDRSTCILKRAESFYK